MLEENNNDKDTKEIFDALKQGKLEPDGEGGYNFQFQMTGDLLAKLLGGE